MCQAGIDAANLIVARWFNNIMPTTIQLRTDLEVPLDQPPLRGRQLAAAVIDNINNNLPIAHLFRFERSNDSIPPRPP